MAKAVKRPYVSAKRDEQAKATRHAIVEAAQQLFVANGYAATTIQAVADAAGVAVQTVYAVFGNKRRLLDGVIEAAIMGDDDPTPASERPDFEALAVEPDAPIVRVAEEAAKSDPDYAPVYDAMKARRRDEMANSAKVLAGPGKLRMKLPDAAATLYALYSPQLADMFIRDHGWSPDRYEKWLADALYRLLLS